MPWYGWLGWILMLSMGIGVLIYFLVRKKQPAVIAETKLKLIEYENQLANAKDEILQITLQKKLIEDERVKLELKLLEKLNQDKTKDLEDKENDDFEKAKADPQSGVNDMRDMLGLDANSGNG